jgi:hypothetical protein
VVTTNAVPTQSNTMASATLGKVLDEPVRGSGAVELPLDDTVTVAESTCVAPSGSGQVAVMLTEPDAELGTVTLPEKSPLTSAVVEPALAPPTANATSALAAQPPPEIVTAPPGATLLDPTVRLPLLGG